MTPHLVTICVIDNNGYFIFWNFDVTFYKKYKFVDSVDNIMYLFIVHLKNVRKLPLILKLN